MTFQFSGKLPYSTVVACVGLQHGATVAVAVVVVLAGFSIKIRIKARNLMALGGLSCSLLIQLHY